MFQEVRPIWVFMLFVGGMMILYETFIDETFGTLWPVNGGGISGLAIGRMTKNFTLLQTLGVLVVWTCFILALHFF